MEHMKNAKETLLIFRCKNAKLEFSNNYAWYHHQNPAQGRLCYYTHLAGLKYVCIEIELDAERQNYW